MGKKDQRILEVYCTRTPKKGKNPLGDRRKMVVAGSCVYTESEYGKSFKWRGVGTVKIIPVPKPLMKGLTTELKKERRKKR